MSQRVNITYSIELEEMPHEVMHLLRKGEIKLQESIGAIKWLTEDNVLSPISLHHLDEIRQRLAVIDATVSDAHSIVEGYLNYEASLAMPEENMTTPPEPALDALIEQFRNSLDELDEITPAPTAE